MPSPERRDGWALLRSQGLGLCCGFATVLLLAVGSFVLAATRDGASAAIHMDDARAFLARPSWVHVWFYLLVVVLGLYSVNTALATWHSVARKIAAGVRAPARYAPAVMHVAFLLALVAHGVGGVWGEERGEVVIAEGGFRPIPGGREARLVSLAVDSLPNGMPREVRALVELRDAAGAEQALVGYNQPISSGLGSELFLLADMGKLPVARLAMGGDVCEAPAGGSCTLGGVELELVQAVERGRMGPQALAQIRARSSPDGAPQALVLAEDRESALADGRPLRLAGLDLRAAILVRARAAPGNPWALAAALAMVAGVLMMWRRFLPRAPAPAVEPE